jgi:predicted aldo/keto reductase-like oxidoreductase
MSDRQHGEGHSRRSFIKKSTAGLAGAAVLPTILTGQPQAEKKKKIIYRTLGKTGLKLPIVSMGVMNSDNPNLVKAALDAGITHLDTAWYYQMGRNERMVGEVLKGRNRDSVVVATKVWEPRDRKTCLFPEDASPTTFITKFETSLKRLQMDYVDILYLHNISCKEAALFEPYLSAMKKLKKEGKIRFLGVSTHSNEPEVIRAAADSNEYEVVLTAYNFKQKNREEVKAAIEYAAKKGLGVVAMKTQAGVYWDGKEKQFPINMKAALKWALQDENVHTSIPGFTTFDQMYLDLSVMEDLTLTPEEKADLKPPKDYTAMAGLYCQQCNACVPQCPANLDIPALMRGYMYAYGYRNLELAKQTLESAEIPTGACKGCATCAVKCASGFNIRERVTDIARLNGVPADLLA